MRHITTLLRRVKNNKLQHSIVFVGTTMAFTVILFIVNYVDFSINKQGKYSEQIYRVNSTSPKFDYYRYETNGNLSKLFMDNCPYAQDATRYLGGICEFEIKGEVVTHDVILSDPSFFNIFDVDLSIGRIDAFTETVNGVVISQSFSDKYFPSQNPIGKKLNYSEDPLSPKEELVITGVMSDISEQSTLKGDLVMNIALKDAQRSYSHWHVTYENYILMDKNAPIHQIEKNIHDWIELSLTSAGMDGFLDDHTYELQCFSDIYLHSDHILRQVEKGNYELIMILIAIASLIAILFVFNYIIVSSGMLFKQINSISIKCYFGISNNALQTEFVIHSLMIMGISFISSIVLFTIFGDTFSDYFGITINHHEIRKLIFVFILGIILMSCIIGLIQYYFATKIQERSNSVKISTIRGVLSITQLSVFIIISAVLFSVSKQMLFIRNTDKGFDLENTVVIRAFGNEQRDLIFNLFSDKSYVNSIAFGQGVYGDKIGTSTFKIKELDTDVDAIVKLADHNYLETYDLKLTSGRNINQTYIIQGNEKQRSKQITEVIVNETFVEKAGLTTPIGTMIYDSEGMMIGEITGVFADISIFVL